MTTRPKGTSLVMTMMMMTNIVGQAEYTNLVMMMMSLRRTNNVGQARRHQPGENDDDDNGHGARRQSLVPSFSISHYSSQNSLHKVTAFLTHLRFNQMSLTHLRCHFSLTLLFLTLSGAELNIFCRALCSSGRETRSFMAFIVTFMAFMALTSLFLGLNTF